MKEFVKQRGISTALILRSLGLAIYAMIVDLICWVLQILGYGLLFINYGIRKIYSISIGQQCVYNNDLEKWKDMDADFIERRKIQKYNLSFEQKHKHSD